MEKQTVNRRNAERFMAATGKSEQEYQQWATQVGQRMHINRLDGLVCARMGIYTVAHLVHLRTELPEGIEQNEVDDYLLDHTENPLELAELWQKTKGDAETWYDTESLLHEHLTVFPKENFERYGDRNCLGDVSRRWFDDAGLPLDSQIAELHEMGMSHVTIEDAIDFVKKYRPGGRAGSYKNPAQIRLKRIEERFRSLTTFGIKDYYAEHLLQMCGFAIEIEEDLPF